MIKKNFLERGTYKKQILLHLCETHNALRFLEFFWFNLSGISLCWVVNKTIETREEKDSVILKSNLSMRVSLIEKTKEPLNFIYIHNYMYSCWQECFIKEFFLACINPTPRYMVPICGEHRDATERKNWA